MRLIVAFSAMVALLVSGPAGTAQTSSVTVEIELDQSQYLPAEDIIVAVRIINLSGSTLKMGRDNGWVKFFIDAKDGIPVAPDTEPLVLGEFELPTAKTGVKRVNLVPHFPVKESGRYTVRAEIEVPGLNRRVSSLAVPFDILNGTVMKSITVGVARNGAPLTEATEQRTFLLQRAVYLKRDQLYVRLMDRSGGTTLKVLPIGQLTNIGEPELQVDQKSRLHVLFRTGPRTFRYVVVTADGELALRQAYEITANSPKLRVNDASDVIVSGGVRREMSSDIPVSARVEDNGGIKAP